MLRRSMRVATFEPKPPPKPPTLRPVTIDLQSLERSDAASVFVEPDPLPPSLLPPNLAAFGFDAPDADDARLGVRIAVNADEETGPSLVSERRARRAWAFGAIAGGALVTILAVSTLIATADRAPRATAKSRAPVAAVSDGAPLPIALALRPRDPVPSAAGAESAPMATTVPAKAAPVTARPTPRVQPLVAQAAPTSRRPSAPHARPGSGSSTPASTPANAGEVAAAAKLLAQARRESSL